MSRRAWSAGFWEGGDAAPTAGVPTCLCDNLLDKEVGELVANVLNDPWCRAKRLLQVYADAWRSVLAALEDPGEATARPSLKPRPGPKSCAGRWPLCWAKGMDDGAHGAVCCLRGLAGRPSGVP